jgi:anti-anti-sigma factor
MFQISTGPQRLEINLLATPQNVEAADRATRQFLSRSGKEMYAFRILLVMREALNNTVQCGTACGRCCKVCYSLEIARSFFKMEVLDDGNGFDWQTCMARKDDPEAEHGHGIDIMRKYATSMQYNEKGNLVTLVIGFSPWRDSNMMDIKKEAQQTIVQPREDIVAATAKAFREGLLALIQEGATRVVIDLTDVEMIDSVGLGVFISTHNTLNKVEGQLTVTNASPDVYKLFRTMGLFRHFDIYETEQNQK